MGFISRKSCHLKISPEDNDNLTFEIYEFGMCEPNSVEITLAFLGDPDLQFTHRHIKWTNVKLSMSFDVNHRVSYRNSSPASRDRAFMRYMEA